MDLEKHTWFFNLLAAITDAVSCLLSVALLKLDLQLILHSLLYTSLYMLFIVPELKLYHLPEMYISLGVQQCLVCACKEPLTKYSLKMNNFNKVLYVYHYFIKGNIVRRIKADRIIGVCV